MENIEDVEFKQQNAVRVVAFNMRSHESVNPEQIEQLRVLGPDIMFLSECNGDIGVSLDNFEELSSKKSHRGMYKTFMNKKYKPTVLGMKKLSPFEIPCIIIDSTVGIMMLSALHLAPSSGCSIWREVVISALSEWSEDNDCPCIIGGDTNMRDNENYLITDNDFTDAFLSCDPDGKYYSTWPNREFDKSIHTKNDFRFDRIFTKRCEPINFQVVNIHNSDHFMIFADIRIGTNKN